MDDGSPQKSPSLITGFVDFLCFFLGFFVCSAIGFAVTAMAADTLIGGRGDAMRYVIPGIGGFVTGAIGGTLGARGRFKSRSRK